MAVLTRVSPKWERKSPFILILFACCPLGNFSQLCHFAFYPTTLLLWHSGYGPGTHTGTSDGHCFHYNAWVTNQEEKIGIQFKRIVAKSQMLQSKCPIFLLLSCLPETGWYCKHFAGSQKNTQTFFFFRWILALFGYSVPTVSTLRWKVLEEKEAWGENKGEKKMEESCEQKKRQN